MPEGDAPASDDTSALPPGHPLADTNQSADDESTEPAATPPAQEAAKDLSVEVEKWKSLARKHEATAKSNKVAADELRKLQEAAMTDAEKAIAAARQEGRAQALVEVGAQVVDATFRATAAGRLEQKTLDALLANIDRRAFMDDDGQVDSDAIAAFVDSIAPPPKQEEPPTDPRWPDLGQGAKGSPPSLNDSGLERDLRTVLGIGR